MQLRKRLTVVEYFTFGFGSMVGVGWLIVMDDWLARGGPAGAMLGYLVGGLLLVPVARTYGLLMGRIQDAGAEIAYTEGVFPPFIGFAAGWIMVLAYAIVCPWEALAIGKLLARIVPAVDSHPLYDVAGSTIYLPRLAAGVLLTVSVGALNYRGIRLSGALQNLTTFGLLAIFGVFGLLGVARGGVENLHPLFAHPGIAGAGVSVLLVLQIVPYFMTGFESIGKGSEEASEGFDTRHFGRAVYAALLAGIAFYVLVIFVVSWVYPWQNLVAGHIGSDVAFERAFGSRAVANLIIAGALLSLFKVLNGNFMAATRLMYGLGRRGLVHPALADVHPSFATPSTAILLLGALTLGASLLGDAALVPITEVGGLAVSIGWLSACLSCLARSEWRWGEAGTGSAAAGALVSLLVIAMKTVPAVPGSFTWREWAAFAAWCAIGLGFWLGRRRVPAALSA